MNYDWMKYEEIEKAVYPNLLAEIKESGFSICTISDFMGLGACEEDDKTIWDKLNGKAEILETEASELAEYYGVEEEYLFAHELSVINGKSEAYWRWYDENHRKEEALERYKEIKHIEEELTRKPQLLEIMKICMTLSEEQLELVLQMLLEKKGGATV